MDTVSTPPSPFPGFDVNQWLAVMSRMARGPEQALQVYRELLGLETGSRERAVDFMAQMAEGFGMDATPFFEAVLRMGPLPSAQVAAAAYLAERGREDVVLEVLESLQPPVLTATLLTGLLEVLATRPATPERIGRLVALGRRFDDTTRYTTLHLGDFTGRDVKQAVRRTIAESLLRGEAPEAVDWPR